MENKNLPAHPIKDECTGLTKLEYASIMAMQGILASMNSIEAIKFLEEQAKKNNVTPTFIVSKMAIENSKELLTQLEKEK